MFANTAASLPVLSFCKRFVKRLPFMGTLSLHTEGPPPPLFALPSRAYKAGEPRRLRSCNFNEEIFAQSEYIILPRRHCKLSSVRMDLRTSGDAGQSSRPSTPKSSTLIVIHVTRSPHLCLQDLEVYIIQNSLSKSTGSYYAQQQYGSGEI